MYCFTSFITSGHQKFWVTISTVFYCPPCLPTGISWCNLMIFALNVLSLGTYTFPSLYIMPSSSLYSLSLSTFTLACFISSTVFTTSSSFTLDYWTFSSKSILSTITFTFFVLLTSNYSAFTNVSSLLSLSTPTSQSDLLLRLSAFPILLPRICFSVKSNLDRYNTHLACLWFSFCTFMKYSRFL